MANEKVRKFVEDGGSTVGALTAWVSRKVLHHDPCAVVDMLGKGRKSRAFDNNTVVYGEKRVQHRKDSNTVIYALEDGRKFCISVEQVDGPTDDEVLAKGGKLRTPTDA